MNTVKAIENLDATDKTDRNNKPIKGQEVVIVDSGII